MNDFKDRLLTEKRELDERYHKLAVFLDSPQIENVENPEELELLRRQCEVMGEYLTILNRRLAIHGLL